VIGLLDPALFLPRSDPEVERDLDRVIRTCREHAIQLVPLDEYWRDLWTDFARPLERQLGPSARRAVQQLRKLAEASTLYAPALSSGAGKAWWAGFSQLFGPQALGAPWEEKMACATLRAVIADREVVMLTRRVPGRNLAAHAAAGSTLDETTRWILHVQPKGIGHRQILCVHHPRNLRERWTARFDWRLPSSSDGARYPFCPPASWWKARRRRTERSSPSRPGWTRTATAGHGPTSPRAPAITGTSSSSHLPSGKRSGSGRSTSWSSARLRGGHSRSAATRARRQAGQANRHRLALLNGATSSLPQ
jgi:hypothetical protein